MHSRMAVAVLLGLVTTLALPATAPARQGMGRAEQRMVKRINEVRSAHGRSALRGHRRLARAASAHSRDMAAHDFFDHTSSDGTGAFARVARYVDKGLMGETLAYMPVGGDTSARNMLRLWMGSPGHRATLLTPGFRRVGVGRVRARMNGQRVVLWTADLTSAR